MCICTAIILYPDDTCHVSRGEGSGLLHLISCEDHNTMWLDQMRGRASRWSEPSLSFQTVMLTWHGDFFAQPFLLRCLPLLTTWTTPGLGLPHEPLSSTSGPWTIGMLPSSEFPEAPASQRDGTTGSKAWSAAPIQPFGNFWRRWSWSKLSQTCSSVTTWWGIPLLQGRRNRSNLMLACRMWWTTTTPTNFYVIWQLTVIAWGLMAS